MNVNSHLYTPTHIQTGKKKKKKGGKTAVSYTHLRAHETRGNLVCRLLLEKKKKRKKEKEGMKRGMSKKDS
ncbi:hypothetical protein FACS189472_17880 [Alphaproteobacteria bacterium]|nr:hypothetical protein FACS189472_17880 [Alphaproteobacteria bacterium]